MPGANDASRSLSISKKKKKEEPIDSWEDEEELTPTALTNEADDSLSSLSRTPPAPPAPTPADATPIATTDPSSFSSFYSYDPSTHSRAGPTSLSISPNTDGDGDDAESGSGTRQAKTDAVARRMIASALGVRTRSTKEQKEYEASLKKKAQEEKNDRRKAEEEKKKAKKAIWDD